MKTIAGALVQGVRGTPLVAYFVAVVTGYVCVSFLMFANHSPHSQTELTDSNLGDRRQPSRTLLGRFHQKGAELLTRGKIKAGLSDTWCDTVQQTTDLPLVGNGCYLRDKLTCDGMPTIHSAFADMTNGQVVFVGVRFRNDTWHKEEYFCEFYDNTASVSDPIVDDSRSFGGQPQYVIIITCPIPHHIINYLRLNQVTHVSLRRASEVHYAYVNVPVCAAADKTKFLAMCTMVKGMDDLIPDWLTYYLYMGVEHVYIYDNSPESESTLPASLALYVQSGFVSIIPWSHAYTPSKTYLEVQIAHENDCMWRHRHDSYWMIKVDVDEFIQPMNQSKPRIIDYLRNPVYTEDLAALRMRNWFFSRPKEVLLPDSNASTVFERNKYRQPDPTLENRGRDKSIARPINIHHYKIHGVKLGGETLSLNPYNELRLVHYRTDNPRHRNFRIHQFVNDTSMVVLWKKVIKWFHSHQYHAIHPKR